ncbi:MAG: hypothetical protein ACJATA_000743 [Sphingobacteriales bacterium]|jgi:hypothetical protein
MTPMLKCIDSLKSKNKKAPTKLVGAFFMISYFFFRQGNQPNFGKVHWQGNHNYRPRHF